MAKYLTIEGLTYFGEGIGEKLNAKVSKSEINTITENNFTTALKTKYDASATVTQNLSTTHYTQSQVDAHITALEKKITDAVTGKLTKKKVTTLPAASSAEENVIYLVPKSSGSGNNVCDEYMLIDGKFELIGDSATNMSGYVTNESLTTTLRSYLTTSVAASTYQTKADMSNYVTNTALTTKLVDYVKSSSLSSYVTTASLTNTLSSYLKSTDAASTYQKKTEMSSYLTTASASSTYATKEELADYATTESLSDSLASYVTKTSLTTTLGSYLTTSAASSTYQTKSGMSSYLTTTTAASTYQKKTDMSTYALKTDIPSVEAITNAEIDTILASM